MTKLSYAWVRNTPLFKSVSTGLTFDEKHKLAVDLMKAELSGERVDFNQTALVAAFTFHRTAQGSDYWFNWRDRVLCKTTTAQ